MESKKQLNILIAAGIYPPDIGGPATYSASLAKELTSRGHRVSVVAYSDKPGADAAGFLVRRIIRSRHKAWHYFKYFSAAIWLGRTADLIYAQDPVSAGYPASMANRILRKPFIVKITGDYSWEQAMGRGLTESLIDEFQTLRQYHPAIAKIRKIQIGVCLRADRIITPSAYLKKLVVGWGVAPEKVTVVYNAVPQVPLISREQARAELGISLNDFYVLSAGRPVKWKGFGTLTRVLDSLKPECPKLRFEILTDAPQKVLWQNLAAADVFALNTGYEGLSHILLEAMGLGATVVTTNVCGNPELITDGVNGLLVAYDDQEQLRSAILRLYRDKKYSESLAFKARETVGSMQRFTRAEMFKQTIDVLQSCAS